MDIRMQLCHPRDTRFVGVMRHVSQCILHDLEAPADRLDDFQVALGEACANAVRYAEGARDYTVNLSLTDDVCEVEVLDLGPGFDPLQADGERSEMAADSESGRGLFLMRALTDDCEFERMEDGTRVRLVKRFPGLMTPG